MGSDDRDSPVYAPFGAIRRQRGYFHGIKGVGQALQLAPKVSRPLPVVIADEVASNGGPSVTNAAASIATQVWRRLLPDAREGIIFVESYQDTHRRDRAPAVRFAEVTFDLDGDALHSPRWRYRERADVEALIGGPVSVLAEGNY